MAKEPFQILTPSGAVKGKTPSLTNANLRTLYRHMLQLRLLDDRMMALQRQGRIGFYGTTTGEEASVIGSAFALKDPDWIYPALRQGGAALLRGYPLTKYLAQLMGSADDVLKGHMQPCHYAYRGSNIVSWSSVVGNQLPQAVGTAMAAKHRGDDAVVMAYVGDGGTSTSDFHVAMNFAGVFQPPVVFLCQNNHWSISVPVSAQTATKTLHIKAKAYGFPGVRVDGNDVFAVYAATKRAVDLARAGKGPTFIEAVTYRIGPHSTADDPSRYRDEEEVKKWRTKDPLERLRVYLRNRGVMDDVQEDDLQMKVDQEISDAIKLAEASGPPPWTALLEDVYAEDPWNLREQREELSEIAGKEEEPPNP
ncbi:MAG: thiamine pyrophosphate-dependent dehydrogenase E1 component subunit alpha [Thermoplasmata archaeon]